MANAALHKRMSTQANAHLPRALFLLLNPTCCGEPSQDSFVFSTSTSRYEYGEPGDPAYHRVVGAEMAAV